MKFKFIKNLTPKTILVRDEDGKLWVLKKIKEWRIEYFKKLIDILLSLPFNFFSTSWYVGYDAKGTPVLLYEYIPYPSLFDLKKKISQNKELAIYIAFKIAKYLKTLHENGVIHGDIKPENILFDPRNGDIIFIDFEHFQFTKGDFASLCIGFSPYHACKEQLEGFITVKTDIRCFALTFFEIYLGKHPFEKCLRQNMSPNEIAQEVAYMEIKLNTDDPILKVVSKMSSVNPEERPDIKTFLEEVNNKY